MPLVTSPASPWESYPFRQHSVPSSSKSVGLHGNTSGSVSVPHQASSIASHPKLNTQASFRDLAISPSSRGSSSSSTMVNSRGSLSSMGSIGTISSRASMASVNSLPSVETSGSSIVQNSETPFNMWQHDDYSAPNSAKGSIGNALGSATSPGATASLLVGGLPSDLTPRECQYIFALASDCLAVDMNRNAVSGEVSITAKFSSLHGAQHANQQLERRTELFGPEVKTSVQSYASPFVTQVNTPRSIYPSRPLFAESYWSQQPASPSNANPEFVTGSRRQSLISPTDSVFSGGSIVQANAPSSPSHNSHFDMAMTSSSNGSSGNNVPSASASSAAAMPGSGSNSPGSSTVLSPSHSSGHPFASASSVAVGSSMPVQSSASPSTSGGTSAHRPSLASLNSSSNSSHVQSLPQAVPGASSQPSSHLSGPHQQLLEQEHGSGHHPHLQHHYNSEAHKLPPPNPADQNPPCNTLYVGNLPPDTSEIELKEIFSQQPGYRRLCFRTKQNGPMCFVEFEDERFAGAALGELYGHVLSNSVKGGIRLSYSKNPLGVRSRPTRR